MAEYLFRSSLTLQRPRDEVFAFFADAGNLELITPPSLCFQIRSPQPINIAKGTIIEYDLSLYGVPFRWRSEITVWEPPFQFVDTQLEGPYKQWVHTHRFTEIDTTTTLIDDEVRYRLPLEPLGDLANFLIERQIAGIFAFRQKTIEALLGAPPVSGSARQ